MHTQHNPQFNLPQLLCNMWNIFWHDDATASPSGQTVTSNSNNAMNDSVCLYDKGVRLIYKFYQCLCVNVNTSIRQVGPVNYSISLQVSIQSFSGKRHPGQRDDLWRLCHSQDIFRRPRRHYQRHRMRERFMKLLWAVKPARVSSTLIFTDHSKWAKQQMLNIWIILYKGK